MPKNRVKIPLDSPFPRETLVFLPAHFELRFNIILNLSPAYP